MINAVGLLRERRFLPLFVTQFLGAFNDNLFKTAMVLFATYGIYSDPKLESNFNALATGLSLVPFFLLSAVSGQLADGQDKARIIRLVKTAEIFIMLVGAAGLLVAERGNTSLGLGLMLGAVLLLGVHSTFFGPIKYAILPQHLGADDVLGGTGLVEAGTYLAILLGTVLAGWLTIEQSAAGVLIVAIIGWFAGRQVPAAPREGPPLRLNWNPFTASLAAGVGHDAHPAAIPGDLRHQFLLDDRRGADHRVSAAREERAHRRRTGRQHDDRDLLGRGRDRSVVINTMLKGRISARYSPISVIGMGAFVVVFALIAKAWQPAPPGRMYSVATS